MNSVDDYFELEPNNFPDAVFFVQMNEMLWLPANYTYFNRDDYCIDYYEDVGISAILCLSFIEEVVQIGYITGATIALPFLLITFIVYCALPKRTFNEMCLMCHVFAVVCENVFGTIDFFYAERITDNSILCQIVGKLRYYFNKSAFFWTNVISFHIWLTFSGIKRFSNKKDDTNWKRFVICSIYAWGVPLFLMVFFILLSIAVPLDVWYNPGKGCWLNVTTTEYRLLHWPVDILILLNVTLFIISAWKIKQARKHASQSFRNMDSKKNFKKERTKGFYLYIKLSILMGIYWSVPFMEWIIWLCGVNRTNIEWNIIQFCNGAHAILIFLAFLLKKSVWKSLKLRYNMTRNKRTKTEVVLELVARPLTLAKNQTNQCVTAV